MSEIAINVDHVSKSYYSFAEGEADEVFASLGVFVEGGGRDGRDAEMFNEVSAECDIVGKAEG